MGGGADSGATCAASKASGLWLLPFGPVTQEIKTKGQSQVMVVVVQGSQKEGEGKPVPARRVNFRIITQDGDASLDTSEAQTDADGLAAVTFRAGGKAMPYQVEASLSGTCSPTFSVDVRQPVRQLRAVTPNPFDTFTNTKVPIAVEATTDGNAKLAGEDITFKLTLGKTGETKMWAQDGTGADPLTVKTNAAGRAIMMLGTGTQAIPQLKVVASMAGTADVEIIVRIVIGTTKPCQKDGDCPLGYTCDTSTSLCEAPSPPPTGGCKVPSDCTPPTLCDTASGKCLQPTGKTCDPIEGTGCNPGEVCIARQCATLPPSCTDNSQCPAGFMCKAGACVPQGQPPGGCVTNANCPAQQACINGQCVPKTACNIAHAQDRLQGTWQYDSILHLRDALGGVVQALLSVSGTLRDVLEGNFKISGVPSFVSGIVQKYLKKLINQYVPPWGQQLIIALGDLNDICSDMRVLSTVQAMSVGNDLYANSEEWNLVEFTYKTKKLSTPPSAIPEIGQVKIPNYTSAEVCGVLFISKHELNNVVGGLVKWAINAAFSIVICSTQGPCYNSVGDALQLAINCPMLAIQIDQMVQSLWSGAPSVSSLVEQGCELAKQSLITKLENELNSLDSKLSLLELSGTAAIPNPPGDNVLPAGKWSGVLGTGIAKGNFDGEFSAKKGP